MKRGKAKVSWDDVCIPTNEGGLGVHKLDTAVEFYDLVDALHSCKQAPRISVSAHVLEMKGYMDQLHAVGKSYDNDMAINLINRDLKRKENCLMVNNICKWAMEHKQQLKL
nr:zinc finger, CCHC-type [Tanacetum cinerariifolium]